MNKKNQKSVRAFLVIVILSSALWDMLTIVTGQNLFAALLMWTPALAALIVRRRYHRGEKKVLGLTTRCQPRYLLMAFGLPILYLGIPYMIYWLQDSATMQVEWNVKLMVSFLIGIPSAAILTFGEELGWRGYLVPKMAEYVGVKGTLVFTGLFWGVWHLPLILSGKLIQGVSLWYATPVFMITILSVGVVIGIITLQAKSVWPAILLHSVHNCLLQNVLDAGTKGANKMYLVGETGLLTAGLCLLLAIGMYYHYYGKNRIGVKCL